MIRNWIKISPFYYFCLYSIVFIFFTFCANYILYDDALYYKSFEEIVGINRIDQIINQQRVFQKVGYGIIPFFLLLRALYTTICLTVGIFLLEKNLKFSNCFNIAIKADIIFLIELVIKINYFSFFEANSLQEVNIHLFSALQYIGINKTEEWLFYPMGVLNIFEIGYWILLSLFLSYYTKESLGASLGFIAKTYGIGLLLWIIFVIYIILYLF